MEFDPNFLKSFSMLSGLFPENPPKSPKFSMSVSPSPMDRASLQIPSLNNNPTMLFQSNYNSFQHFQHNPQMNLNSSNPNLVFPKYSPSLDLPLKDAYANEPTRDFNTTLNYPSPNNKMAMDSLHGYRTSRSLWDLSQNVLLPSRPPTNQMDLSLPPYYHQPHGSSLKVRLRDEPLSCFLGINNIGQEEDTNSDQRGSDDDNKKRRVKKHKSGAKDMDIIKGQWTPEEDRLLVQLVDHLGIKKWSQVAEALGGRMGKQCRERWHNHLRPDIRKDAWTEEEDTILIEAHKELGNKWAEIARRLPGRSENTVKNHWNATKRRQLAKKFNNKPSSSRPSLLQDYIMQVTHSNAPPQPNHDYQIFRTYNNINNNNNGKGKLRHESITTDDDDWDVEVYTPDEEDVAANKEIDLIEMIRANYK